jgi:serine/threonine protein kinase
VFHRDIAPDNILLLPDGRPVLLDFGSARRVIGDATQSLTAVLKPNFAPIEQYADVAGMRQGPWTDIYALGATVHFVLTGNAPAPAVLRAVHDDLPALAAPGGAALAGVADRFLVLIDWCLALAPQDRPQSVGVVRQALDGRVVPPSASMRQRIDPRRFRDQVGNAHAVDPSSVFDTMSAYPDAKVAPKSSSDAAHTVSARRRGARIVLGALALAGLAVLGWSLKALTPAVPAASMVGQPVATADAQGTPLVGPSPASLGTPGGAVAPGPARRNGTAAEAADSAQQLTTRPSPSPTVASARRASPGGGPSSPKAACGKRNYFTLAVCISRECQNPRWHAHPQCADTRAMEERRQRQVDQH